MRPGGLRVAIDAGSIRAGGGLAHLRGVLESADPAAHGIDSVEVWAGRPTLEVLPAKPWLTLRHVARLDAQGPRRYLAQVMNPPYLKASADVVFAPSGWSTRTTLPTVTMAQNMLPFEPVERARYGASWMRVKLRLLQTLQARTFEASKGLIFLSQHSMDTVSPQISMPKLTRIIPHGIDQRFLLPPRPVRPMARETPLRVVYVSSVEMYKHQWVVAEAVARLRNDGMPIEVDFIGPAYAPALARLQSVIDRFDGRGEFLRYRGAMSSEDVHTAFHDADLFVFASTCESFSLIVLQAMAAGLPIVSSRSGAVPEILGQCAVYADTERPEAIAAAIQHLVDHPEERAALAAAAYERAQSYTWAKCADATMGLLREAAGR